jgi:hypothetical protein
MFVHVGPGPICRHAADLSGTGDFPWVYSKFQGAAKGYVKTRPASGGHGRAYEDERFLRVESGHRVPPMVFGSMDERRG